MDVDPPVGPVVLLGLPRVDAHPHQDRAARWPVVLGQRRLGGGHRVQSAAGTREGNEERVRVSAHLYPLSNHVAGPRQEPRLVDPVGLLDLLRQPPHIRDT